MLELKAFNPRDLNRPVQPFLRWIAGFILAAGGGYCLFLVIALLRHWESQPNPTLFLAFIGTVGGVAALLSVKLFRGDRLVRPVDRPPRPWVVRALGLPVFIFAGISALLSDTLQERVELGVMALTGLGWVLWPRHYLPPNTTHSA